jgi:DNA invertase Pin-like site-specific DNA recombinase
MTSAAVWIQASIGHQGTDSQAPDVERFIAHHGYQVTARYEVTELARDGGKVGGEYQRALKQALEGAQAGRFQVLVVSALDRITRNGADTTST